MNAPDNMKTVLGMTADTVGKDLLSALVAELKLMPEPWQKMPKRKQNDIIDRLRDRVAANVKMAVHLISASGRIVVSGGVAAHTAGMDEIQGEDDQRSFDLGNEYHDNDGGGMQRYADDRDIEGEGLGLPSPDGDESEPAA